MLAVFGLTVYFRLVCKMFTDVYSISFSDLCYCNGMDNGLIVRRCLSSGLGLKTGPCIFYILGQPAQYRWLDWKMTDSIARVEFAGEENDEVAGMETL